MFEVTGPKLKFTPSTGSVDVSDLAALSNSEFDLYDDVEELQLAVAAPIVVANGLSDQAIIEQTTNFVASVEAALKTEEEIQANINPDYYLDLLAPNSGTSPVMLKNNILRLIEHLVVVKDGEKVLYSNLLSAHKVIMLEPSAVKTEVSSNKIAAMV